MLRNKYETVNVHVIISCKYENVIIKNDFEIHKNNYMNSREYVL